MCFKRFFKSYSVCDCFWEHLNKSCLEHKLTFLVGNGLNKYIYDGNLSWNDLIERIAEKCSFEISSYEHLLPTEQYSALVYSLKEEIVKKCLIEEYNKSIPDNILKSFKEFSGIFEKYGVPVITTNIDSYLHLDYHPFDIPLSKNIYEKNPLLAHSSMWSFNHYFAPKEINDSVKDFAIWHLHGHISHEESLRFGLIDYIKLMSRIYGSFFTVSNSPHEKGRSWLEPILRNDLCILGLGLSYAEVGIRYLLMRRAQMLKCNSTDNKCWYLYVSADDSTIQFCKSIGITTVKFPSYSTLYDSLKINALFHLES